MYYIIYLVEFFFHVRLDLAIRRRVRNARQHKSVARLVVIQERLVRLVNRSRHNLTRARRACARSARVRQVDARFFCSVQDVRVVRTVNLLLAFRRLERNRVVHDHQVSSLLLLFLLLLLLLL